MDSHYTDDRTAKDHIHADTIQYVTLRNHNRITALERFEKIAGGLTNFTVYTLHFTIYLYTTFC